jgi:hypothetical protein
MHQLLLVKHVVGMAGLLAAWQEAMWGLRRQLQFWAAHLTVGPSCPGDGA